MIDYLLEHPLVLFLALATAVFGVGRLSRVLTYDAFPPAAWVRLTWARITKDGDWSLLAHCQWCATPWLMAACLGWAWLSDLHWTWWVFWGWLGVSYLASIVIARDEPAE